MRELISCPGCGKKAMVEVDENTRLKDFNCPSCSCRVRLVFNRNKIEDEMKQNYFLAKDYPG